MAAITVRSDFAALENKICHYFHFFPFYLPWSNGTGCHDLKRFECWVLSQLFHSPLTTFNKSNSSVPFHFLLPTYNGFYYFFKELINIFLNFSVFTSVKWSESCSVMSDSLWPHELYSPWISPGQNTGVDRVGSLSLLQVLQVILLPN